jgi:hypothetical protein
MRLPSLVINAHTGPKAWKKKMWGQTFFPATIARPLLLLFSTPKSSAYLVQKRVLTKESASWQLSPSLQHSGCDLGATLFAFCFLLTIKKIQICERLG